MHVLITAGPTREPVDAVRFIGNRSSGRMGMALAEAALARGHSLTLILGPVCLAAPPRAICLNVETAAQMHAAVLREFAAHDLLIMAAAVADYRPKFVAPGKLQRGSALTLELEPTPDIVADAGMRKRVDQRTVGFSLETAGDIERAREKMLRKSVDLIVFNGARTMESDSIEPTLLWPDGRREDVADKAKSAFGDHLMRRAEELFQTAPDQ